MITFSSADYNSQIDYILVKKSFLKQVREVQVIRNKECITQHKSLIANITVDGHSPKPRIVTPRREVWKLRDPIVRKDLDTFVNEKCTKLFSIEEPVVVNDAYKKVKTFLLNDVGQVCSWTRGGRVGHAEF